MNGNNSKVIFLSQRYPDEALRQLNRITGLHFSSWPQSLRADAQRELAGERLDLEPDATAMGETAEVVSG